MNNKLTAREQEIFELLIKGISPKDIAYKLHISYYTVDGHRNSIYRKLNVKSVQELIVKYGIISKDEEKIIPPSNELSGINKRILIIIISGIIIFFLLCIGYFLLLPASAIQASTELQKISGHMLGFYANTDIIYSGNSSAEVYISSETINGYLIDDVINIKITLKDGYSYPWAHGFTNKTGALQYLRKANGIRFKARGNGEIWKVHFNTTESLEEDFAGYQYCFNTINNEVVEIDIPYSSLTLPWYKNNFFDFKKEHIIGLIIGGDSNLQGLGSFYIQIFDFETY